MRRLLLAGQSNVAFYCMREHGDGFKLSRYAADSAEIELFGVRQSAHFAFEEFEQIDPPEAIDRTFGTGRQT
ncbi:hypothetical protein CJO80_16715 [Ralstonia solanacearum]|nr:hypothetical protein CJO80_16715 [Ralstonia solanacearum]